MMGPPDPTEEVGRCAVCSMYEREVEAVRSDLAAAEKEIARLRAAMGHLAGWEEFKRRAEAAERDIELLKRSIVVEAPDGRCPTTLSRCRKEAHHVGFCVFEEGR